MATYTKIPLKYLIAFKIARLFGYDMKIEYMPLTKYPPVLITIKKRRP